MDSAEGLQAALAGGADRIELCAALSEGGLTPSAGLMRMAAGCGVPVMAMIRPRAGDFVYTPADIAVMRADIAAARAAGLAGIVLGATLAEGQLDAGTLAGLLAEGAGLEATLHRAIDLCPDPLTAVDLAITLGFRRILSSGGAETAGAGAGQLARMMARAGRACIIMPGAGITAETLADLSHLPLREVHASCSLPAPPKGRAGRLGFAPAAARRTDSTRVAALKAALAARALMD